jgi:cupin 2 domain-containing protein
MRHGNIFNLGTYIKDPEKELFELLFQADNCRVERIVSSGHVTPDGNWYNQEQDEWVVLLQGTASLQFYDNEFLSLRNGDFIFIPAQQRHRVISTSIEPPCIWLAIHGDIHV